MKRFVLSCFIMACGGTTAPPPPVATNAAPSATASTSTVAAAPVVDAGAVEVPKTTHEPPPLLARPAGAVCTWDGTTSGSIALRGDATGDVLARFTHDGAAMHLFLAPSGAFAEIHAPHVELHGYMHNPLGLHARHDIAIGDLLTLKQGAEPEVILDHDKLMVTTLVNHVAFKGDLNPKAPIACDDLALAATRGADKPRGKLFALLGSHAVDLYAQTNGGTVAAAHDDAAEIVEQQGAWSKMTLEDDSVRVTAWVKTSSVTVSRDPAKFLAAKVATMQMQMLGAFGGTASTVGAQGHHSEKSEKRDCAADVTVFLRKQQTLVPIVRLSHPALELRSGGVVELPRTLGVALEPGVTAAIDSRDEAVCH